MHAFLIDELSCDRDRELLRLTETVRSRLGGRLREFSVFVLRDGLVLRGRAASYHIKQLTQHAVMDATRLRILANEIEVGPPPTIRPEVDTT